jgi:hypothetical protein
MTPVESYSGPAGSVAGAASGADSGALLDGPGPQAVSAEARTIAEIIFIFMGLPFSSVEPVAPNPSLLQGFFSRVRNGRRLW